jgi:hypothetical protein
MEKSEKINEIAGALVLFQEKKPKIDLNSTVKVKTKTSGEYSFKYATLGYTLEKIQPVLTQCKIAYTQLIESDNSITTMIIHSESGQYLSSNKPLDLPDKVTAQEVGSFITYYKRYALLAMLGVVAEDDEDGNIASGNTATKEENNNPWLNRTNQKGELLEAYTKVISKAREKGLKLSDLMNHYKMSKETQESVKQDLGG